MARAPVPFLRNRRFLCSRALPRSILRNGRWQGVILSDRDLLARLQKGDLVVRPLDDPALQVQPASIDLRLGNEFLTFRAAPKTVVRVDDAQAAEEYTERVHVPDGEEFILHPGEFALATTYEWLEVPPDLVARVEGRSSLGRLAIIVHATAGYVDPGFKGCLTLELSNLGKVPVALRPKMRVSQIVLHELKSEAQRPYGEARGSKYQGQRGPTPSRIASDDPANRTRRAR